MGSVRYGPGHRGKGQKGCPMRIRMIQLMILTTGLLVLASGCNQGISAPQPESDGTVPAQADQDTVVSTFEQVLPDEEAPPTTRPTPGISALDAVSNPPALTLNNAMQGVVDLLRAGVGEEVLLAHIGSSPNTFDIDSDEIIFLTDLGAPGQVISAMIERDEQLHAGLESAMSESASREPWPPAGTVVEVPALGSATYTEASLPIAGEESVVVDAPAGEISVDQFYDSLAPYGTWIDVPDYGLCWQPTVAVSSPGWMPYGDRGRWVYTNHGWYWYSDYSWGWAAFHYGRWFHNSRWGWCWSPGTVWGPSWVSWRYSDPYCGWAPLPPYSRSGFYLSVGISWGIPSWCYTYVPSRSICNYYPRTCAVPYKEARRIHGRSRARNHYAVGRNHTIENRGIPPEQLTDNSARDIRRAAIKERHEIPASGVRRERLEDDGKTLTVYRPRPETRTGNRPQTASRTRSRATSRDEVSASRVERSSRRTPVDTSTRNPSRNRSAAVSSTPRTIQSGNTRSEPSAVESRTTSVRSPQSARRTSVTPPSTVSNSRRETSTRDRSINPASQSSSRVSRQTTSTIAPGSSLVIIGKQNRQRTSPSSVSSRTTTIRSATPASRPATATVRQTQTRSLAPRTVRSQPRLVSPSTRTISTSPSRTEVRRTAVGARTRTIQSPSATRATTGSSSRSFIRQNASPPTIQRSTPSIQPSRVQPSRRVTITPSPQRTTPSRAVTRSVSPPSSTVRSAPTVRSVPSRSPTPQRAPAYSPPSSARSAPSAAPRSAPRSAPPGRSENRSGGRSR